MSESAAKSGWNLATLSAEERAAVTAQRAACLERFSQARAIADRLFAERSSKGKGWRMWAEREIAKHPALDAEIRRVLNWRLQGKVRD